MNTSSLERFLLALIPVISMTAGMLSTVAMATSTPAAAPVSGRGVGGVGLMITGTVGVGPPASGETSANGVLVAAGAGVLVAAGATTVLVARAATVLLGTTPGVFVCTTPGVFVASTAGVLLGAVTGVSVSEIEGVSVGRMSGVLLGAVVGVAVLITRVGVAVG